MHIVNAKCWRHKTWLGSGYKQSNTIDNSQYWRDQGRKMIKILLFASCQLTFIFTQDRILVTHVHLVYRAFSNIMMQDPVTVGLTKGFILTQSLIGQLFPGTPSTSTWTEDTSVYYPAPAPAYATAPAAVLPETQPACYYSTGCSSSCGQGFKVLVPDQAVHACNSLPVQVLPCTEGECPVDCRLTHWTTWSVCSPATVPRELLRILPREREGNSDETETDMTM